MADSGFTGSDGRPLAGQALRNAQAAAVREREAAVAERERHLADRERALRRARAEVAIEAGMPAPGALGHWSPGPQSGFWSAYPDHDPRFLSGEMTLAGVRAEYAGRALERRRREAGYYGRDRMPAAAGVPVDEQGIPRQRSVVHADVPELGT